MVKVCILLTVVILGFSSCTNSYMKNTDKIIKIGEKVVTSQIETSDSVNMLSSSGQWEKMYKVKVTYDEKLVGQKTFQLNEFFEQGKIPPSVKGVAEYWLAGLGPCNVL